MWDFQAHDKLIFSPNVVILIQYANTPIDTIYNPLYSTLTKLEARENFTSTITGTSADFFKHILHIAHFLLHLCPPATKRSLSHAIWFSSGVMRGSLIKTQSSWLGFTIIGSRCGFGRKKNKWPKIYSYANRKWYGFAQAFICKGRGGSIWWMNMCFMNEW